ncbi:MAG: OmpA family protein [Prevotella ruminicola]|jgi:outer membrane protein OmpA-like peptidoglycan-associated protein|uniref:OmpA family protein n=1 Tax=Xylanibacter ruminicola TaxID=839 RepID=A0A928BTD2_XYLRU|nr:OmpA family protein [Xylanibacter ruminicola]
MKNLKSIAAGLCAAMVLVGCNVSNTAKGTAIGAGGGAVVGAIIGKMAGNTAIGAVIGGTVGATTGAIIGKKMDKAKKEAEAVKNAQVETITDANGLEAVKVTFDSGILFATNKADLNATSKASLTQFAEVLKENRDMDIAIIGHTDNTGSDAINNPLSKNRAQSVSKFLKSQGVASAQIKTIDGQGSTNPVADNSTAEGRKQNRRVEVYMYASEKMINEANAEAGK